jgi:hypothetical protein
MQIVHPTDVFRRLNGGDIKIDDDWFLAASNQDALKRLLGAGVDLLVRNVGRDIDEVACACLGGELEMIAPSHASPALDYVDHAFKLAVMMCAGFRIGMNAYGAGPELRRTGPRACDRSGSIHAWSLWRVRIKLAGANYANSVMSPIFHF